MLNVKLLINLLNPEYTVKYLYLLLFIALIPFLDCLLITWAAIYMGEYLFLACLLLFSFIGFFLSKHMLKKILEIINLNTKNHYYSEYYYNMIPATLLVAFFLIMPGILGSFIALVISIPALRYQCGKMITRFLKIEWKEIHEFINIIE